MLSCQPQPEGALCWQSSLRFLGLPNKPAPHATQEPQKKSILGQFWTRQPQRFMNSSQGQMGWDVNKVTFQESHTPSLGNARTPLEFPRSYIDYVSAYSSAFQCSLHSSSQKVFFTPSSYWKGESEAPENACVPLRSPYPMIDRCQLWKDPPPLPRCPNNSVCA